MSAASPHEINLLRQSITSPATASGGVLDEIHASLNIVASRLDEWGRLISSTSQEPNPKTVQEVADYLDALGNVQDELLSWLNKQSGLRASAIHARLKK